MLKVIKRPAEESNQPEKNSAPVTNEAVYPPYAPTKKNCFGFQRNNMNDLKIPKVNCSDLCLKFHVEGK